MENPRGEKNLGDGKTLGWKTLGVKKTLGVPHFSPPLREVGIWTLGRKLLSLAFDLDVVLLRIS